MRIGVDATCWQNTRGYGRHARSLLKALVHLDTENRYTFFLDSHVGAAIPQQAEVRLVRAAVPTATAAAAAGHRSLRDMWQMSRAMSTREFDLLLFPTVYSYIPVVSRAKKLVMIHDVIAETFPQLTLPSYKARLFWKAKVAFGCWQADAIVTVSDYACQGIRRRFHLLPDRVAVVGEASDPIFRLLEPPQLTPRLHTLGITTSGRYLVYVGGFNPHKNIHLLLETFAALQAQETWRETQLVLVGEYKREVFHSYADTLRQHISTLGIQDHVIWTGFLADEDLVVLLNLATVLVLPSFMEGFGLPAIEAAACGCPVIATTASPLPQLLGEGGLYIDPTSGIELQQALTRVMSSPALRQHMRQAGLAAARQLTWEAAAQQLHAVITRLGDGA